MDSFATKLKKFFSHPTGECAFLFSLFYTAAVSFPHVVVLVYWTILVPARDIDGECSRFLCANSRPWLHADNHATVDDLFSHDSLQTFAVLNLYFLGALIALFELFFLSSVRRPGVSSTPKPPCCNSARPMLVFCSLTLHVHQPSYSHILGLTTFAVTYFGWAYIGHYFTGKWVYYFLNYKNEGFENVFVAMLAFISLLNIFYGFIYGLTGIREAVIDGEEGHGHQRVRGVDGGDDDDEARLEYDQYRDCDE